MLRRYQKQVLAVVLVIFVLSAGSVVIPDISIHALGIDLDRKGMRLGLDLQGGTHLVYKAQVPNVSSSEMDGLINIIQRRVNAYGVAEPVIQRLGDDRILVQLPGVKDIEEAKRLIGKTAQLDFREQKPGEPGKVEWVPSTAKGGGGVEKHLTGKFLRATSAVVADPNTGLPEVSFHLNDEGAQLFEQITTRLLGKPLGIFLDGEPISAPTVQAVITSSGVITGLTEREASVLAIQLNAGALPVPIAVVQERDVDATLGADSLRKSLFAGMVGIGIVLLFIALYYKLPGLMAGLGLLYYVAVVLAIFKLIPVTLTLPGIAGFILSVGMAVDANVLIFERMKEELWLGRTLGASIESGFDRAWTAIRDSNLTTIIAAGILFWFADRLGATMVAGFALILAIGVSTSMLTALIVTRTLLRSVAGLSATHNLLQYLPLGSRRPAAREGAPGRGR